MYNPKIETCSIRLALAMAKRGIKQSEICRLTGIPKSSLSLYLSGAYEPKQDRVYLLAQVLNVSEAWLMGYDIPMEREKNSPSSEDTLTEGELALIELFRKIPKEKQDLVLQMIKVALGNLW